MSSRSHSIHLALGLLVALVSLAVRADAPPPETQSSERPHRADRVSVEAVVEPNKAGQAPGQESADNSAGSVLQRETSPVEPSGWPGVECPIEKPGSAKEVERPQIVFSRWLEAFKRDAQRCGISPTTIEDAFKSVQLNEELVARDRRQAEYELTFLRYLRNSISDKRILQGRKHLRTHGDLLRRVDQKYGVEPSVLVALWAMESNFGAYTGSFSVLSSLTTLAYEGRRSRFFRYELLNALRILDTQKATPKQMRGSWAGAMGQPQFMPSTFVRFAADGNADGRYDIWSTLADVFMSAANYLASIGWRRGEPWGVEVRLPKDFDAYEARLSNVKSDQGWQEMGVTLADGRPLSGSTRQGAIVLAEGFPGPAFLVYENFRRLMEWNRSLHYALTVGHLSDRFRGAPALRAKRATGKGRHNRKDLAGLQSNLGQLGFEAGEADGMVGVKTRQAIRDYQRQRGLIADAYPSAKLIASVESEVRSGKRSPALSAGELTALQEALLELGFQPGKPDGRMGSRTRWAVADYQAARGLRVGDEPTADLLHRVQAEVDARHDKAPVSGKPAIQKIQRSLNDLGFVAGSADGIIGESTRTAIAQYQRVRHLTVDSTPSAKLLSMLEAEGKAVQPGRDKVRVLQTQLSSLGYKVNVDGLLGAQTTLALRRYREVNHLAQIDTLTRGILLRVARDAARLEQ